MLVVIISLHLFWVRACSRIPVIWSWYSGSCDTLAAEADLRDMVGKAFKSAVHQLWFCILTLCLVLHGLLQLWRLLNYQNYGPLVGTGDTPENTIQDANAPEPGDEGDIQMESPRWLVVQLKFRSSNNKLPVMTWGCLECLIIWHLSSPMGAELKEFYFNWGIWFLNMQCGQKSSYLLNVWFCMCVPCTVVKCGAWQHCHQYVYVHTTCHGTLYMAHSMHSGVHVLIHVVVRGMVRSQTLCMFSIRILLKFNLTHSASYVMYLAHKVFHITSFPTCSALHSSPGHVVFWNSSFIYITPYFTFC
jgi:hypothetical protein